MKNKIAVLDLDGSVEESVTFTPRQDNGEWNCIAVFEIGQRKRPFRFVTHSATQQESLKKAASSVLQKFADTHRNLLEVSGGLVGERTSTCFTSAHFALLSLVEN